MYTNCLFISDTRPVPRSAVSPNSRMRRAVKHRVLGRGRPSTVLTLPLRARVLTGQPAGADEGR